MFDFKLGTKGAKATIKTLLPRVAPDKKATEYTTAIYTFNVYVDWLEGLGKDVWDLGEGDGKDEGRSQ